MKILWLFLFFSLSAQANDCPEISLDNSDPSLQGIPVWNQGSTPSCYVYSSSLMATYWARKEWGQQNDFVVNPYEAFKALMNSSKEVKEPIMDAENGRTCMSLHWILKGIAENSENPSSLKQPICRMYGMNKFQGYQTLKDPSEFKERMNELIAKREIFSIEYCSGVIDQKEKAFIKNRVFNETLTYLNTPEQSKNFDRRCGFHVSVVVGQAMRNGKCMARIRNSWGRTNGDNGYNWVDLDDLALNTLRIITIE